MAFIRKMEDGSKTPILYSMYGKLYDFNDLQRRADSGLEEYLGTLKRGQKDYDQFMKAYTDIMNGIKDGSITFSGGTYHDSQGRYTNSDKKNRDYYGLMANYIYGLLKAADEYVAPEDPSKIKWNGLTSIGIALNRNLFNSDNGNLQDFIDVDPIDPTTGKRDTKLRAAKLYEAFNKILNNPFENQFTGYTPSDVDYRANIEAAMEALKDGSIDAGDYLALNKAAGGIDFRNMFSTEGTTLQSTLSESLTATLTPEAKLQFVLWVLEHYPQFTGTLSPNRSLSSPLKFGEGAIKTLNSALNQLSTDDLTRIARSMIADRNYVFNNEPFIIKAFNNLDYDFDNMFGMYQLLLAMEHKGLLSAFPDNLNMFYIPGTATKNLTGWVWDKNSNQILEKSFHDIPYWRNKIILEYNAYAGGIPDLISSRYAQDSLVASHAKGGVRKTQNGTNSNIFFNDSDFGYNTYLNLIFNNDRILSLMLQYYNGDKATENYANYIKNNVNARYSAGVNEFGSQNNSRYTGTLAIYDFNRGYLNAGNTFNYVLFGNNPDEYNSMGNGIVYLLANFNRPTKSKNTGDSAHGDINSDYIDNALGAQTYSRVASLTDPEIKSGGFGKWGNYWKALGNTGAYYYIADGDTSGKGLWIPTSDTSLNGYQAFDTPQPSQNIQTSTLTIVPPTELPSNTQRESLFRPVVLPPKREINPNLLSRLNELGIDLMGANRLGLSLHANNRIAKTVNESLNPVLLEEYERFSPVVGDYQTKNYLEKQGADVIDRAKLAITSDAYLHVDRGKKAFEQKNDLGQKGDIADDKEIKRTSQEALIRLEDNRVRRTNTANKNLIAINLANREIALLEASRLKYNWQSIDNYLKEIELRLRAKHNEHETLHKKFALDTEAFGIYNRYTSAAKPILDAITAWQADPRHNGQILSASTMPGYNRMMRYLNALENWRKDQMYRAEANIYGLNYTPKITSTLQELQQDYSYKNEG